MQHLSFSSRKGNVPTAPEGVTPPLPSSAHARSAPAGKLHHGGERPCAGPQRQEAQTHLRYGPTATPRSGARPGVKGTLFGPRGLRFSPKEAPLPPHHPPPPSRDSAPSTRPAAPRLGGSPGAALRPGDLPLGVYRGGGYSQTEADSPSTL